MTPTFPEVFFFFPSCVGDAPAFFARYWPGAAAIADPDGDFYVAFNLRRASWWQLLGPRVLFAAVRALFRGNPPGKSKGDVLQMPGIFLVRGTKIEREFPLRHAGELPDLRAITSLTK